MWSSWKDGFKSLHMLMISQSTVLQLGQTASQDNLSMQKETRMAKKKVTQERLETEGG